MSVLELDVPFTHYQLSFDIYPHFSSVERNILCETLAQRRRNGVRVQEIKWVKSLISDKTFSKVKMMGAKCFWTIRIRYKMFVMYDKTALSFRICTLMY